MVGDVPLWAWWLLAGGLYVSLAFGAALLLASAIDWANGDDGGQG